LETVQDRGIITMEDQQEIMLSLLKGSNASERTFQQLKWPSRSLSCWNVCF